MAANWHPPAQGTKARKAMPRSAFLVPSQRKYPFKVKRGGRWVTSPVGLRQAYKAARFQGNTTVMNKARKKLKAMGKEDMLK